MRARGIGERPIKVCERSRAARTADAGRGASGRMGRGTAQPYPVNGADDSSR